MCVYLCAGVFVCVCVTRKEVMVLQGLLLPGVIWTMQVGGQSLGVRSEGSVGP